MRPFAFRVLSPVLAVGAVLAASETLRSFAVAAVTAPSPGSYDLYLEVFINGVSTNLIATFRHHPDGGLSIAPEQLANIGLTPDPSALRADGHIDLARLPGVSFAYDPARQSIDFTAVAEARPLHIVGGADDAATAGADPPLFGLVINYGASLGFNRSGAGGFGTSLFGWIEPRLTGTFGAISAGFALRASSGDGPTLTRLGTTWAWSSVANLVTYRAGDVISGGLSWTRPIHLGGIQIQRNFALRPDLITYPVPGYRGTAEVPSTLEVYIDDMRRLSAAVPAGPFEIAALPILTGGGEARIVLRDGAGRETIVETPFFASPSLLRPGLVDFSIEAGFPRLGYGTDSSRYVATLMASATARIGISDGITLQAHAEGGAGAVNGGLGALFAVGHSGVASIAGSGAFADGGFGYQLTASVRLALGPVHFAASVARTFGAYSDVATEIAEDACAMMPCDTGRPRVLGHAMLWLPVFADAAALSLAYTHSVEVGGERAQIATASIRTSVAGASLFASAYADFGIVRAYGVMAGLSVSLGDDLRASATVRSDSEGTTFTTLLGRSRGADDALSWQLRGAAGHDAGQSASFSYRAGFADFDGRIEHAAGELRGTIGIDGAVVLAGGGAFFTPPIRDAFALVEVGVPGIAVYRDNRFAGVTDESGRLLIANLRSYEANRISIDPANLPLDANIGATTVIVVPHQGGGVSARFEVETAPMAAVLTLRRPDGSFVAVGSRLEVAGGATTVVGYDGMAYVTGLAPANRLMVTEPSGARCVTEFAYAPVAGRQVAIDLACHPL